MLPESGALRVAVDCSVDNVYRMSDKVLHRKAGQQALTAPRVRVRVRARVRARVRVGSLGAVNAC